MHGMMIQYVIVEVLRIITPYRFYIHSANARCGSQHTNQNDNECNKRIVMQCIVVYTERSEESMTHLCISPPMFCPV